MSHSDVSVLFTLGTFAHMYMKAHTDTHIQAGTGGRSTGVSAAVNKNTHQASRVDHEY